MLVPVSSEDVMGLVRYVVPYEGVIGLECYVDRVVEGVMSVVW